MYGRGGFMLLVKRVARYESVENGTTTALTVPTPVTLFPRGLLHTSTVTHLVVSKFLPGVVYLGLDLDLQPAGA